MSKFVTRPRVIGAVALCLVGVSGFGAGMALAAQPHMQAALSALETAKVELEAAVPDKGGHRVKALADVNAAIGQVRAGIAFAM